MNCLIIKMGGSGHRFGKELPKQFTIIKGKPYFAYIFADYSKVSAIDKFIVVTNIKYIDITQDYATQIFKNKLLGVIAGGNSNLQSTYNGIKFATQFLKEDDILLTHDITNSSIDNDGISKVIAAAKECGSATLGIEQVHTLYERKNDNLINIIKKETVVSAYTPEAYKMAIIKSCFENASEEDLEKMTSPLSIIIAKKLPAKVILSNILPLKLTYSQDLDTFIKIHGL